MTATLPNVVSRHAVQPSGADHWKQRAGQESHTFFVHAIGVNGESLEGGTASKATVRHYCAPPRQRRIAPQQNIRDPSAASGMPLQHTVYTPQFCQPVQPCQSLSRSDTTTSLRHRCHRTFWTGLSGSASACLHLLEQKQMNVCYWVCGWASCSASEGAPFGKTLHEQAIQHLRHHLAKEAHPARTVAALTERHTELSQRPLAKCGGPGSPAAEALGM